MRTPTFIEEKALMAQGFTLVAGVDEVGCGCWAGPVYAAAVILPIDSRIGLIRDSKKLSALQREWVIDKIKQKALVWSIGIASHKEVDQLNIRQAAFLASRRAIQGLTINPEYILSDGFTIPELTIPCKKIIRGDAKVKSIAAASIIAKVARDEEMRRLEDEFPGYGFGKHKGYGTRLHQRALKELGPSPIHRMTYAPIKLLAPLFQK